MKIPAFDFTGIKRITIPKVDGDFSPKNGYGWDTIKKYLPRVLSEHKKNSEKIKYLYNYFLGEQDILQKERLHDVNKKNNNKNVENHANRQVEFKVGFLCGEKRDYTHKSDTDTDDLVYLDRYFTDCGFFSKDADLKEWVYTTGIGVTKTTFRNDLIVDEGFDEAVGYRKVRYADERDGYNVKYEAPFKFDCVDPTENFVVYSSGTDKQSLFCVSYVDVDVSTDKDAHPNIQKQILVETRYAWFKFNSTADFVTFYWGKDDAVESYFDKQPRYLPLIEFSSNKDRLGIVEKNRSSFNTINLFRSSVNDMVVDNSNAIFVFKNVDIDSEQIKEMREAGAVIISDSQNARIGGLASIDTVTVEMPLDKLAVYLDQVMQNAYDIVGVPLASGQVTSGGDTGQARLLGGGWNNAYIIINKEKLYFTGIDYEQLKLILALCREVPNCPLNELYASQVDINYRVNQNDNLLVKAQAMKNLFDMHLPSEFILKVGGLSNDIKTDSKDWQENIDRYLQQEHTVYNGSSEQVIE